MYVKGMGFEKSPCLVVQHRWSKIDHVHILASRVDFDAKVVSEWKSKVRAEVIMREVEKKYDLERLAMSKDVLRAAPRRHELEWALRTGEPSVRMHLQDIVDRALAGQPTAPQFLRRLEAAQIEGIPYFRDTGKVGGISFRLEGEMMKGRDLGRGYSWSGLQKRGLNYEHERDFAELNRAKEQAEKRGDGRANLSRETKDEGTSAQTSNLSSNEMAEVLTRLDENSARLAEIERQFAVQKPDAERFAQQIGPIVLATKNLREEIEKNRDAMKQELQNHQASVTATLDQISTQIGQHRANIETDVRNMDILAGGSDSILKESKDLLQQSMTVYSRSTQMIEEVSEKASTHITSTAQSNGKTMDEQISRLAQKLRELEEMYDHLRTWIFFKAMLAVIISSIVGAFIGTSVITISTWHRINATEEKERDSAKWQYLLDQQDKKDPQGGAKFNRTIEQEMKNQNSDRESPNK
jgi:hypothetical protein